MSKNQKTSNANSIKNEKEKNMKKTTTATEQGRTKTGTAAFPGFSIPKQFKFNETDDIVSRRKEEEINKNDPAQVKAAKDQAYLTRLQYIVSVAKQRIAEEGTTPLMTHLIDRALNQVKEFGETITRWGLKCFNEETIQDTALRLCGCIFDGKYNGGNPLHYIKRLMIAARNEEFTSENGLKGAREKVYRALRQLEDMTRRMDGRDPEQITAGERYEYMRAKGRPERTAAQYANSTSDSLKTVLVENYESSIFERGYNPIDEVFRADIGSFYSQFDPSVIARHPAKNRILWELNSEGDDIEEIFAVGVCLMVWGFNGNGGKKNVAERQLRLGAFEKECSDDIYLLYRNLTGDKKERSEEERKKVVRKAVRTAKEIFADKEKIAAVKEIISLLFEEARAWVRELHEEI